jgi:integrase
VGRRPLRSLSRADVRGFCAQLMLPTEEGGKGLHQTTAHNVGRTLHIALAVAVDDGLLVRNPASGRGVIPPARSRSMSWWSEAEVAAFLEAVDGDPIADFFHLALDTGAREGELLALRWRDLDLDRGLDSRPGGGQAHPLLRPPPHPRDPRPPGGEPVPDVAARLGHDPATMLRVSAHAVPPASRGDRRGFLDRVAAVIAPR